MNKFVHSLVTVTIYHQQKFMEFSSWRCSEMVSLFFLTEIPKTMCWADLGDELWGISRQNYQPILLFTHSDSLNSFHVTGYYSVSCQLIPHFLFFPPSSSLHSPPTSNLTWCADRLPLTSISPFFNPALLSSYLHFDLMFRKDLP